MFKMIWRTIKNRRISLLAYSISAVALMEMFAAMFPTFAKRQGEFDKLLEIYPEEIFQVFGTEKAEFTISKFESFIGMEHFSIMWPILVIVLAISFGSAQIAGEIEKGTIEMLISQPISRIKLFFSKYIAGVFNVFIFTILSIFSVVPLAAMHRIEYNLDSFTTMTILGLLFGIAIFSVSMLASSMFSEKSKANFLVGGMLLVSYAINILSNFIDSLENLKYISVFYYFDFSLALNEAKIEALTIWVFVGIIMIATAFGAFWFSKRDIAT